MRGGIQPFRGEIIMQGETETPSDYSLLGIFLLLLFLFWRFIYSNRKKPQCIYLNCLHWVDVDPESSR